jgi:hypothetical protein
LECAGRYPELPHGDTAEKPMPALKNRPSRRSYFPLSASLRPPMAF